MAPRKKSAPAKKGKPATKSANASTRSGRRSKSTPTKKATAASRRAKTSVTKKSPKFISEAPPVVPDDDVQALELTITSIALSPDPPVHDQSFTVTVSYSPDDAALTIEIYVSGSLRSSKRGTARQARFSPDDVGNPAAGATGQVKATISHPMANHSVSSTRSFTFA
ncbi:MAG TPA: hypothetical protein VKD90_12080 [Gemmataceae bacterium]|nr:hypothetical protein [Gemmataceae bacterium]